MKHAKKILQITALTLFSIIILTTAQALNYDISQHTINIQISADNTTQKDTVVEKFFITFPAAEDKINFRENSLLLGTSVEEWKKLNTRFMPSLGENAQNKKISYTEGEQNYLQISYDLKEPLMAKGTDAAMITEYNIKVNYFNSFYQSGLWIIPEGTTISIEMPPGAEIRQTPEPQAEITKTGSKSTLSWKGYKSGNKVSLTYVVWKKTTPVIDLNGTMDFLFKTKLGWIITILGILAIGITAWQRKKISKKIEEFVEKHSIIKEE